MCGIAGYFGNPGARLSAPALLERMLGELRHRGPDGEGVSVLDGAGLAHTRLSIIDLAAGQQPMANDDGDGLRHLQRRDLQLRRAARSELIARGRRFRTDSDTEVIIRAL